MQTFPYYLLSLRIFNSFSYCSARCSNVENGIDMCNYLTNQEMKEKLHELNETYSNQDLVTLSTIGKSVLGEELYYLKITSNATKERKLLKPMFK